MLLVGFEFYPIIIFLILASVVASVIVLASFLLVNQKPDPEKLSAYECGFEPFNDARNRFDVRFYLVAILFILFDLEAAFLFPWCVSLSNLSSFSFWAMVDFLVELTIGFIYAWKVGSLEWE